jgi:hypothetical protein
MMVVESKECCRRHDQVRLARHLDRCIQNSISLHSIRTTAIFSTIRSHLLSAPTYERAIA